MKENVPLMGCPSFDDVFQATVYVPAASAPATSASTGSLAALPRRGAESVTALPLASVSLIDVTAISGASENQRRMTVGAAVNASPFVGEDFSSRRWNGASTVGSGAE